MCGASEAQQNLGIEESDSKRCSSEESTHRSQVVVDWWWLAEEGDWTEKGLRHIRLARAYSHSHVLKYKRSLRIFRVGLRGVSGSSGSGWRGRRHVKASA